MNSIKYLAVAIASLFILVSCDQSKDNSYLVPNISGKANEVIVVINKKVWDGQVGDSLHSVLTKDIPGLPQAEPYFDVSDVPPKTFANLESLKTFRNLVMVDISNKHTEAGIGIKHNKWAKQQVIVTLRAKDKAQMIELLNKQQDKIRQIIRDAETKRIWKNYNKYANLDLIDRLKKEQGIAITIPKNYRLEQKYSDFLWIAHETPEMSQGIFVYWYPYESENQFTKDSLIVRRSSFVSKYVPGPLEGSYMTTDTQSPIEYKQITLREEFATEMRGLWFTEGDFMGGPFVSVSKVDKEKGRIVTAEGFVYAPKFPKRNYMLQVEEIIKTLRIDD